MSNIKKNTVTTITRDEIVSVSYCFIIYIIVEFYFFFIFQGFAQSRRGKIILQSAICLTNLDA